MFKHLFSHKLMAYLALMLSICISMAQAVEVTNLYVVQSAVKEQSKSVEWKASIAGFKEVLIRNSGSDAILRDASVQKAYRRVTDYLQRFEYSKQDKASFLPSVDNQVDFLPYFITLYFEPRLINELIQGAQMSLWGASRPLTALWLVIEENNERKVIKESLLDESIEKIIFKNAQRRGLPVLIPLMDLEDDLLVSKSDIWGLFSSSISTASSRYSADSSLFGRIRQDGILWVGKFGFLNQNEEINFDLKSESKEQLISQLINKLSELLCSKYCVVEEYGQKNEIYMDISNIYSFKRFKTVETYLAALSSIRFIEMIQIDKTHLKLKLTLLGQIESLIADIDLSQKMLLSEQPIKINDDTEFQAEPVNTDEFESLNQIKKSALINNVKIKNEKLKTLYYRWVG